tara:strand:+ start:2342 stop:3088 length:747 start_codon:yes stop_codon:yes gene_type:complete
MRKILFILITALIAFGCSSDKSSVVEETAEVSSTTETPMTATEEEVVEEEVVEEEAVEEEATEEEAVEEEVVEEEAVEEEATEEEETTSACDSWDADPKITVGWPGHSGDFPGPSIQETARIGAHEGYDRWVLEFRPGSSPPGGWQIWWTGNTIQSDGDFDPTATMEGTEFLTIRMLSSSGWALPEEEWYDGPRDLYGSDAGTSNLMQASLKGDFEGYSTWGIGVDHEAPFNVFTLAEPSRLVIDICH